jgi:hypothetical protein
MPDAQGFETPQEAQARILKGQRDRLRAGQASSSSGTQLGASLGAIFGPAIRKSLDTREAREEYAQRLVRDKGIPLEEAREQAKISVGREFKEVRKAQDIQRVQEDLPAIMATKAGSPASKVAQAQLEISNRLRSLGMITEANALALQAHQALSLDEEKQLEMADLRAQTAGRLASTEKTRAETEQVGKTTFQKNLEESERIRAVLASEMSISEEQKESFERRLGWLDAKMLKDTTITGKTVQDVRSDRTLQRKMFTEFADSSALIASIDNSIEAQEALTPFEATRVGRFKAGFIGFLEQNFARKPTESEQEYIDRIVSARGQQSLVAAKVRHALTGAQMSAFEIQYLEPFLPSPSDSRSVSLAKLKALKKYNQLDQETRMAIFETNTLATFFQGAQAQKDDEVITTPPSEDNEEAVEVLEGMSDELAGILGRS